MSASAEASSPSSSTLSAFTCSMESSIVVLALAISFFFSRSKSSLNFFMSRWFMGYPDPLYDERAHLLCLDSCSPPFRGSPLLYRGHMRRTTIFDENEARSRGPLSRFVNSRMRCVRSAEELPAEVRQYEHRAVEL